MRWIAFSCCALCFSLSAIAEDYTLTFTSFAPLSSDIFVANADGSGPEPLAPHPALDYNARFSEDGHWVVFTSERGGSADIFRVRLDGTMLERLTDDPAFDDQAALSADGRRLAFVSTRSGNADIWTLDLDSGELRNVTNHPAGGFRPAWSRPDGSDVRFTENAFEEATPSWRPSRPPTPSSTSSSPRRRGLRR